MPYSLIGLIIYFSASALFYYFLGYFVCPKYVDALFYDYMTTGSKCRWGYGRLWRIDWKNRRRFSSYYRYVGWRELFE